MRIKNISILLAALLMTAVSCDNQLDLSPISSYNADNFYSTQSDFERAVNGIYDSFQDVHYYSKIPFSLEGRSDNVTTDTQYDPGTLSKFIDDETTGSLESIWYDYWIMIDRCNAVLDQVDNGMFDNEEYRNYYKGEASFMRGYAYFQLGWLYGGVPLIDHQISTNEISETARSSQNETLSFAIKDLTLAASLLPDSWSGSELGKVTQYAAKGILARLYLLLKNYSSAKPLLADIISSENYELANEYSHCFLDSYDNSKEQVLQVQYTSGDVGEGNELPIVSAPEDIESDMFPQGGGSPYLHVSKDLYDSYEAGDIRRDFSIQKGYTNIAGVVDTVTCFYIKFAQGAIPPTLNDYEVNMPVLRYTDVKLMYAEVLNEEAYSSSGDAFTILNEVRSRAGLTPLTSIDLPDQSSFRIALFNERRWEFAGEYLRWFDLIRSGKAINTMNTFLLRKENGINLYNMKDYQQIFAIPQYELDINSNTNYMWQNPGY